MNKSVEPVTHPPARPLTVWILTIWNGISAGLVPLLLTLSMVTLGTSVEGDAPPALAVSASLALALAIMGAAWVAWKGRDWGRKALLGLLTVHYGLFAYRSLQLALGGLVEGQSSLRAYGRVLWSIVWIMLNFFYLLLRPDAVAFYRSRMAGARRRGNGGGRLNADD